MLELLETGDEVVFITALVVEVVDELVEVAPVVVVGGGAVIGTLLRGFRLAVLSEFLRPFSILEGQEPINIQKASRNRQYLHHFRRKFGFVVKKFRVARSQSKAENPEKCGALARFMNNLPSESDGTQT